MNTMTVKETAELLNKPEQFVRIGLQQNVFPFGTAVKMDKHYSYVIYKKKLEEYIGEIDDEQNDLKT